jgi:hypothetical protein
MKNWEKQQTRIASAKTAREFITIIFNLTENELKTDCYFRRLKGKCDSNKPKVCEECILDWLNSEVE